ncbi:MAG: WD40/YVTN/BNR-like repeat-containing protein [Longimicrobiales bacterium]
MCRRILCLVVALCAVPRPGTPLLAQTAASPAPAPQINPTLLRGMTYRLLGPSRGGRVTAVTGVPSQPRTFYMGVASGGLFRTTDAGENWQPISDGKIPVGSMGAIAVADSDPRIIYVGTGSDGVRSNVSTGRGVYRSNDGGESWQFIGLYNSGQIGAVRIHPANPDIAWVAAYGDIFKPNSERGVFKTTDGGKSWKKVLFVSDSTGAMDVELQPGNPNVVYAWMNRIERKPWTIISGAREGGFYKSTNGGDSFQKIATGLPNELIGKGNLAVTAANPSRIYALVEAKPGGGLYRSDDAGQSWQLVNSQGALVQRPFYYTTLGADPTNADVVYAGAEGFFKSTDGGKTMQSMRTPHGDNHDIWINPNNGQILVQANDGGANVSNDGGRTWSTQMNQVTSEIYGVWLDNAFPYKLYGAQQDNSTIIIPSTADAFDRTSFTSGPGCETGPIIPHPRDSNIVYGSCKGQYEVYNARSGQTKPYWVGGQSLYGNPARDLILRFQRVSPMETSPHDPNVLYYGSQHVHRTRDLGVTWETISGDLTAKPACCQGISGEPITRDITGEEFYSTLYSIRESTLEPGVIWVGSNDGPFHVTRDNGKTWTNITPRDLPSGGRVQFIEPSPHRRGSAYYAVYRYLLGDYQPYLYRTDDYGRTWTRLTDGRNGIPADWPTRVVREDPNREGLLYAGTEFGMFISFDNGTRWQAFNLNMPNVPITDIKVYKKDLVIATQGRAFWILDNVTPLHQLTPQTATQQVTLYKPRDGFRTRESPHLLGPNVDYYLPTAATGAVIVDILNGQGQVVNSYSSASPPVATGGRGGRGGGGGGDPDDDMMEGRTGRGGAGAARMVVTTRAGHNRFVWDARHQNGLAAPPGSYQARLKVSETTLTQPFNLLIDPNLAAEGVTVADLNEQFEHNVRVATLVTDVNGAVTRVRQAQQSQSAGTSQRQQIDALAGKLLTEPVRYGKPGLQAHITYLRGMTNGVDMRIGRDAIERYNVLRRELDAVLAELNRVLPASS